MRRPRGIFPKTGDGSLFSTRIAGTFFGAFAAPNPAAKVSPLHGNDSTEYGNLNGISHHERLRTTVSV